MIKAIFSIFHVFFVLLFCLLSLMPICPTVGLLCAFGCRESPAQQIVSSAQFRSFIMPRDVRRNGCIGCCRNCGEGDGEGGGGGGGGTESGGTEENGGTTTTAGGGGGAEASEAFGQRPLQRTGAGSVIVGMSPTLVADEEEENGQGGMHGRRGQNRNMNSRVWYSSSGSGHNRGTRKRR